MVPRKEDREGEDSHWRPACAYILQAQQITESCLRILTTDPESTLYAEYLIAPSQKDSQRIVFCPLSGKDAGGQVNSSAVSSSAHRRLPGLVMCADVHRVLVMSYKAPFYLLQGFLVNLRPIIRPTGFVRGFHPVCPRHIPKSRASSSFRVLARIL